MVMIIPKEVENIVRKLNEAGFEACVVGGCVRDFLLERQPQDWDVTTNAKPEEILKIFPGSFYENQFGTIGVKTGSEEETLALVEVTTFRAEERYTDKRHPDIVRFVPSIEEDLKRRDFTINALALRLREGGLPEIIDLFDGQNDLKKKIIRAVGDPNERFSEDALRLLRAVRIATELSFTIEEKTLAALKKNASLLKAIAKERIRDEIVKIIMTSSPLTGFELLRETKLLRLIMPELEAGWGVTQNKHHIYTVWEHNLRALQYTADKGYELHVRMAALLHDVSKPETKQGEGPEATFYGHEVVGAKVAAKILERLRFPRDFSEKVVHLVRFHLFYYNVGEVTEAGVRRFLRRVGPEYIEDLIKVREADRIGSGVPKAKPYKIRHLLYMIEKVSRDPISAKMLKVNGNDIMEMLAIGPGPKVGYILNSLLAEVLDDPQKNEREYLKKRIGELSELSDKELEEKARKSLEEKDEFESGIEQGMKAKYYV
jgi:poly(A) polymerase/tRNA nucleotidyltransferase (CCA-adding enzyme)